MRRILGCGAAWLVFLNVAIPTFAAPAVAQDGVSRDDYLQYARASADCTWEQMDELLERWRAGFDPDNVFGYRPPGGLLEMAVIYAFLYEQEGSEKYADRAKSVLLTYGDFRSAYPQRSIDFRSDYADGVPALPDFFTVMRYIKAFDVLNRHGRLSDAEREQIEALIAHSMDYLLRTAEWGTMNRTMLRAESLAWAVRAMPEHPRAAIWDMQRRALGDDNWGNWEIEDATIYHGVWLYALLGYADCLGSLQELFRQPEVYYYAQYFLHLMSPFDMIPDFGDAHWNANWRHYLVFFEAAATAYRDPRLKWAAGRLAGRFVDFDEPTSVGLGVMLLDAYRFASDDVEAERPESLSAEVMEDVQGKKIVFRSGWGGEDTYMLLNYRDESDGGLNFRDYLRDTIPVEEEKMTHGHADENSIVMLASGGALLLHDGGYRDFMPSGPYGAYRQDYFHNRLCVRPEKIFMGQAEGQWRYSVRDAVAGQGVLEFLRNAGSYRPVRTQKVDFLSLPDFDYSRTRLIDSGWGFQSDRVIVYVKDPEMFVVFDIFKARTEDYFTLANLWHTRKIVADGEHWYDTVYDRMRNEELPQGRQLLIYFPHTHFRLGGAEPERRHYQNEILIHQTTAHHFELGETEAFVTVLVPHDASVDPEQLVRGIRLAEVLPDRAGIGVVINAGHAEITVGVKCDLRMDMARDWRRPRYTYEAGKLSFGPLQSNGDFLFARRQGGELSYTIVNLTRALYGDRVLFETKESFFGLAFDASPDSPGAGKVRYWRDVVEIADEQ